MESCYAHLVIPGSNADSCLAAAPISRNSSTSVSLSVFSKPSQHHRQCPVSPGLARYFLAMRQESTQRSAPSSPPAAPVPSLQAPNAAGPETRFAQTAVPDISALTTFRSAAKKGRRTAPLSAPHPSPLPPGEGEDQTLTKLDSLVFLISKLSEAMIGCIRWFSFIPFRLAERRVSHAGLSGLAV